MGCPHPRLVKIANMPEGTYRCERCRELVNVTIAAVRMPRAVKEEPCR